MTKPFFEVFPGLQLTGELSDLFEETEVARIAVNRERSKYAISVESGHLIHRRAVDAMQETLADRISQGSEVTVYIREQYHLSDQYTLPRLSRAVFSATRVFPFPLNMSWSSLWKTAA